ncbi:helix-turn-helix transcriptional regulator [Actinoplanes sp. URMC 104]|uniref:helix-turn-helix transcriptional regulator n=1 Tax=Actinoplanes sp. URMC 104 TaxID=3423409 RepID=UPI003F1B8273
MDAFAGMRLAQRRSVRGWTQVELAERLQAKRAAGTRMAAVEVARQLRTLVVQISCYESGRTRPRAGTVRLLAEALGVDVLDLLAADAVITLAVLRARLGLTQEQAAQQLGISRSLYALLEQGRRPVSEGETHALARVLQVSVTQVRAALPHPARPGVERAG